MCQNPAFQAKIIAVPIPEHSKNSYCKGTTLFSSSALARAALLRGSLLPVFTTAGPIDDIAPKSGRFPSLINGSSNKDFDT
jgi:hypothetical protein